MYAKINSNPSFFVLYSSSLLQGVGPSIIRMILLEKHLLKSNPNSVHSIVAEDHAAKMGCTEMLLADIPFEHRNEDFSAQTQNGLFLFALTKMVLLMTLMRDIDLVVKFRGVNNSKTYPRNPE